MEFLNHTAFPAVLIRGIVDDDTMFGSLVVRVTFSFQPDGRLQPAEEQVWKTSPGPWDSPAGPMPGDELFYRGGVDFFVLGAARAPGGQNARRLDVSVEIGDKFRHQIAVFGNRVWEKRRGQLQPTPPEPFTAVPLTLANAYGGKDVWDELPIPFPDNPEGKGYYLEAGNAAGQPLPNLEDPGRLIQQWSDQPEPVGTAIPPYAFGPRLRRSLGFDSQTGFLTRLDATFYNHAFPGMVAPKTLQPDERVRVEGVRAQGPIEFRMPRSFLAVHLRFADRQITAAPAIDQIGIEPDKDRVFLTYRHPFRYRLVPLQKRVCELGWLR